MVCGHPMDVFLCFCGQTICHWNGYLTEMIMSGAIWVNSSMLAFHAHKILTLWSCIGFDVCVKRQSGCNAKNLLRCILWYILCVVFLCMIDCILKVKNLLRCILWGVFCLSMEWVSTLNEVWINYTVQHCQIFTN